MLRDSDLGAFLRLFQAAEADEAPPEAERPDSALRVQQGGLFPAEIWRLFRSMQVAAVVGDAPSRAALAVGRIAKACGIDMQCASLDDNDAWVKAIRWSIFRPEASREDDTLQLLERQSQVGLACARLRAQGYRVRVGAYGPEIDADSRKQIAAKIDNLFALLGGADAAGQICRFIRDSNLLHDGMWIFGDKVPNIGQTKSPGTPIGWLFSLTIRHLGRKRTARKPKVAWATAVKLAIDMAACMDCQRYSQFEQFNIHPAEFWRALAEALQWRELFSLPQVPPLVLPQLRNAFNNIEWPDGADELISDVNVLFREIEQLLSRSADDSLSPHPRDYVRQNHPLLWRFARIEAGKVNARYADPLAMNHRNHDRFVIFETNTSQVITLPRPMMAAAACEVIFRLIWTTLKKNKAAKVVGSCIEKAVERACQGKAAFVLADKTYSANGKVLQLDVATRTEDKIILFEMKAKSLTASARSGDLFAFIEDYTESFLALLSQLTRHEHNLRQGTTPLTEMGEAVADLRPIKVAVSPLSYGPVSDHTLASALLRSMVNARLYPVNPIPSAVKITEQFNAAIATVMSQIAILAPKKDDKAEIFPYLIDIFWLDLGQLLYVLDRASTTWDAFAPLRHITFSTRDFWTELAIADRQGLARGRWRRPAK